MVSKKPRAVAWSQVKQEVIKLDRLVLVQLIGDLYQASQSNQLFLSSRFGLGGDVLEPYKAIIDRWVCPDFERNQDVSVGKATRAVANYRKAVGDPGGIAELSMYYCEACADFLNMCGMEDEDYFDAIVATAGDALDAIDQLPSHEQDDFIARLEAVRWQSIDWGWGVSEDIDQLMIEHGIDLE